MVDYAPGVYSNEVVFSLVILTQLNHCSNCYITMGVERLFDGHNMRIVKLMLIHIHDLI